MSAASLQTRFKAGNKQWKARKSNGRPLKYSCPDQLETVCTNYFEWASSNPLYRSELVTYRGRGRIYKVPVMRPFSITALCNHLKICSNTWANYKKRPDLLRVNEWAETVIFAQKYEGVCAGIFNAKIIARDMQLRTERYV